MDYFKLNKIDEFIIHRKDHYYLTEDDIDICAYLGEYIATGGFAASTTNNLINNFKIQPSETHRLPHKQKAIDFFAKNLVQVLSHPWLKTTTIVPIPPSKSKSDPNYDDRMNHLLKRIGNLIGSELDVREFFIQNQSTEADHLSTQKRPNPEQRKSFYTINESLLKPLPKSLLIIDDMITTGSHFKAFKSMLAEAFPGIKIYGIFLSRRIEKQVSTD